MKRKISIFEGFRRRPEALEGGEAGAVVVPEDRRISEILPGGLPRVHRPLRQRWQEEGRPGGLPAQDKVPLPNRDGIQSNSHITDMKFNRYQSQSRLRGLRVAALRRVGRAGPPVDVHRNREPFTYDVWAPTPYLFG